jgi:hypothetical protein
MMTALYWYLGIAWGVGIPFAMMIFYIMASNEVMVKGGNVEKLGALIISLVVLVLFPLLLAIILILVIHYSLEGLLNKGIEWVKTIFN